MYLLSTGLADRFNTHVVVGDYGQPQRETRDGVTLHRAYPLHPRRHPLQPIKHLLILWNAMRWADADVYVHRGSPRNAAFVYLIARSLRKRWVYNLANDANIQHRPESLPRTIRRLYYHALANADGIIAQTPKQQTLLERHHGVSSAVVPNGYPTVPSRPPFEDREYVLWVGSLDKSQKRPHLLLDLAEQIPNVSFRLAGPCEDESEYQRTVRNRAEQMDNVEYLGTVPPSEIHRQYERALALVTTSAHEGFPNTLLEAWRYGTPVVGLDIDPGRYLDQSAECYAVGSMDRLREIVLSLTTDSDRWETISSVSKSRFESTYALTEAADQYATALTKFL